MAEYYDYSGEAKLGYDASNGLGPDQAYRSTAYRHAVAGDAAEFNPRADSGPLRSARENCRPPPPPPAVDSSTVAAPRWWLSPAAAAATPPNTSYGGAYPPPLQDMPISSYAVETAPASNANMVDAAAVLQVDSTPAPVDRFPAEAPAISNNPYLTSDAVTNRPPSTWHQEQVQDWSEAGSYRPVRAHLQRSAASRATDHGERGVFHPIFSNAQSHAGVYPANVAHDLPQFAVFNRPRASPIRSSHTPMHSDSTGSRARENDVHCWPGSHLQGRLSVGKSQSMRALYEENAALRRALQSIRRSSANMIFESTLSPLQSEQGVSELDRCLASDVAEGRAVSMRERGRWAMQATGDGSFPLWVGTPSRQWATGAPFGPSTVQDGATAHHRRPRYHCQSQWWDQDITADHPLYYGGGSFGGWPETEPTCWDYAQNECPANGAAHDHDSGLGHHLQGTSLKQLLGGGSEKWQREGKKKGERRREVEVNRQWEMDGVGHCAMCGGRLRHVEGGKSRAGAGGLPLRLCPACHPRAAASLPHSTKSPPTLPSSHSHRHRMATAVLMACRPTPGHHEEEGDAARTVHSVSSKKPLKSRGGRNIFDLCRHFVGLSTKPSPPSSN